MRREKRGGKKEGISCFMCILTLFLRPTFAAASAIPRKFLKTRNIHEDIFPFFQLLVSLCLSFVHIETSTHPQFIYKLSIIICSSSVNAKLKPPLIIIIKKDSYLHAQKHYLICNFINKIIKMLIFTV